MANEIPSNDYPVNVKYTIRSGDTLNTISKATGIPVSILAKDNNLKNPDKIIAGQAIDLCYHPEDWEVINGAEMNEWMPNHADQVRYFEEMDAYTKDKYETINRDGAQKHINSKW